MIIKVASKDKKSLTSSKQYIGTGSYKDADGFVWDLIREGSDFIIKRIATKKFDKSTTERYWSKVFGTELAKEMFEKSVVAKQIKGDLNGLLLEADLDVIDTVTQNKSAVKIKILNKDDSYSLRTSSKDELFNGLEVYLREKIANILDSFEREEAITVMANIIQEPDFHNFLLSACLSDALPYEED